MRFDDFFVGSVAMALAGLAVAAACSKLPAAYRLRSVRSIQQRFGEPAVRFFFLALATLMFASGAAIWGGLRPPYSGGGETAGGQPASVVD